jgi:hypothetical protein
MRKVFFISSIQHSWTVFIVTHLIYVDFIEHLLCDRLCGGKWEYKDKQIASMPLRNLESNTGNFIHSLKKDSKSFCVRIRHCCFGGRYLTNYIGEWKVPWRKTNIKQWWEASGLTLTERSHWYWNWKWIKGPCWALQPRGLSSLKTGRNELGKVKGKKEIRENMYLWLRQLTQDRCFRACSFSHGIIALVPVPWRPECS